MAEEFYGQSPYERQEHEPTNRAKKVNTYVWNSSTLQWEKMTQPGASAAAASTASKVDDTTTTSVVYIGKAELTGAAISTASAVWQIKKLDTSSLALDKKWADGNDSYDNVWDNRASLTYY